jgi:hypothetical protein
MVAHDFSFLKTSEEIRQITSAEASSFGQVPIILKFIACSRKWMQLLSWLIPVMVKLKKIFSADLSRGIGALFGTPGQRGKHGGEILTLVCNEQTSRTGRSSEQTTMVTDHLCISVFCRNHYWKPSLNRRRRLCRPARSVICPGFFSQ